MEVVSFIEISKNGNIKKASVQLLSLANKIKGKYALNSKAVFYADQTETLVNEASKYNVDEVCFVGDIMEKTTNMSMNVLTEHLSINEKSVLLFHSSSTTTSLAPKLATKYNLNITSGVVAIALDDENIQVKKSIYSGKAFANYNNKLSGNVFVINPNSIPIEKAQELSSPKVSNISSTELSSDWKVLETSLSSGKMSLPEADLVVSGGRGLKGPENWNLIEDLANILGATTACSRPVSDSGWRPHNEHVGQTGITISPSLYIAVGISGAIQHLAGVNSSKIIVVINKDQDAPFFKAADYGIVGDAFEVVPKLIDYLKTYKAA